MDQLINKVVYFMNINYLVLLINSMHLIMQKIKNVFGLLIADFILLVHDKTIQNY